MMKSSVKVEKFLIFCYKIDPKKLSSCLPSPSTKLTILYYIIDSFACPWHYYLFNVNKTPNLYLMIIAHPHLVFIVCWLSKNTHQQCAIHQSLYPHQHNNRCLDIVTQPTRSCISSPLPNFLPTRTNKQSLPVSPFP